MSGRRRGSVSVRILTISICHGERGPNDPERAKGSKGESNHPEDVSSAMLSQGVLLKIAVLPSLRMRDGSYYEFWVYILTSRTGTLYVGVTGYLGPRITQHKIDSIEGFTKKYKVHRLVYHESYEHVMTAIRREKQLKGLASAEEDCTDRKDESTLAGLGGELGPGNALPGTISQENALSQHGRGHILGVLRLALIPLRGTRAALRMTRYKQFSPN
jgi:predicted GIY-YIG superfamily endonuclease